MIRNARNQEVTRIGEEEIKFATSVGGGMKRNMREAANRAEDGALAEMIAKALSNPGRASLLDSTLREFLHKEELAARASREGANLPLYEGDYIRIRGDLRKETEPLHHHYAKILSVEPADIAGIENAHAKPGQPTLYRTLKKYRVVSSEGVEADIYDAEVKLFYTANGRKTILNWRAATLLAEAFSEDPPYNVEYDYLLEHVFTREELQAHKRSELAQILAALLVRQGQDRPAGLPAAEPALRHNAQAASHRQYPRTLPLRRPPQPRDDHGRDRQTPAGILEAKQDAQLICSPGQAALHSRAPLHDCSREGRYSGRTQMFLNRTRLPWSCSSTGPGSWQSWSIAPGVGCGISRSW